MSLPRRPEAPGPAIELFITPGDAICELLKLPFTMLRFAGGDTKYLLASLWEDS